MHSPDLAQENTVTELFWKLLTRDYQMKTEIVGSSEHIRCPPMHEAETAYPAASHSRVHYLDLATLTRKGKNTQPRITRTRSVR
jgi:hypothetical protein